MVYLKYVSILFFASIFSLNLYSQNIKFEHLSLKDGLSQGSVTCITQDSLGFLWFGTYNGLNRYDGYEFKVFLTDPEEPKSISHNFIRCSYVDRRGTLWIGTDGGGLNRYNFKKENFNRYQFNYEDSTTISNNSIYTLFEDRSGNLWIGTWGGGINKVEFLDNDRDSLAFIRYQHNPQDPISLCDDRVSSIQQDKDGLLWIGTRHGISIFDPVQNKFIKRYIPDPDKSNTLSTDNVSDINIDNKNNIWIATWGGGLNKYDSKQDQFIIYENNSDNCESISHNIVLKLYRDFAENLWIGTWGGGLNKLKFSANTDSKKTTKLCFERFIHNKSEINSISGNSIYDIYQDGSGILWIGTDWDGVNKCDLNENEFKYYPSFMKSDDLRTDNSVFALHKDKTGILWLGTRGNGLISYNIEKGISKSYVHDQNNPNSISNNVVRSIYEDKSGRFWIGTEIGFNRFDRSTGKFTRYYMNPDDPGLTNVFYIYEDREGYLWLGTWDGGLSKFDPETNKFTLFQNNPENPNSFPGNIVWCITEDLQNHLWIGTDKNGLIKYDRENNQFISFKYDKNNPNSISDNKVLTIYVTKNGDIWLGTTTGVNRIPFSKNSEKSIQFENFPTQIGLSETTILGIMEDKYNHLWIGNSNYLTRYDPVNKKTKNYHISDKLHIGEFNVNAVYKDPIKEDLYFGGINGFVVFNPDSIDKNTSVPKVSITDFKLFGKSIDVSETINGRVLLKNSITVSNDIKLNYKDDVFSIEFSALHYNAPEFNRYAYTLDGFENKWNYVDAKHRIATYTNLDPGEYIFRVKASNNDDMWSNESKKLRIIVTPPFWMTWWFRIIAILWTILFIIVVYKIRTNQIRKRNLELAEINSRLNDEIKERHRVEEEIRILNVELERRVEHRTEELESFAYAVSHDLRAPLRSMQGFSNELIEGLGNKLEDRHKDYFNRIISASSYMSQLIDDLLKLSRVTRTNIKKEKINLSNIVEQVANSLKIMEPGRDVNFNIDPDIEAYGDKNLIRLVIENLVSNSWKFSENIRDVVIEFRKIIYSGKVTYIIKDNGIGFDMDYVNKLFEPFHRLNIGYTGTGIGLATVRRIIKLHGGIIWAEGEVNVGATFYFTLPK